jgi:hypothetical protein
MASSSATDGVSSSQLPSNQLNLSIEVDRNGAAIELHQLKQLIKECAPHGGTQLDATDQVSFLLYRYSTCTPPAINNIIDFLGWYEHGIQMW